MFTGFASWLAYIIALLQEMGSHLFVPNSGGFAWAKDQDGCWILVNSTLPQLSTGGKEFVDSLVTTFYNVMTYLAQVSALLPANTLHH
jgi:hypothetical protein